MSDSDPKTWMLKSPKLLAPVVPKLIAWLVGWLVGALKRFFPF